MCMCGVPDNLYDFSNKIRKKCGLSANCMLFIVHIY